jgi:hypothetical protein
MHLYAYIDNNNELREIFFEKLRQSTRFSDQNNVFAELS